MHVFLWEAESEDRSVASKDFCACGVIDIVADELIELRKRFGAGYSLHRLADLRMSARTPFIGMLDA